MVVLSISSLGFLKVVIGHWAASSLFFSPVPVPDLKLKNIANTKDELEFSVYIEETT